MDGKGLCLTCHTIGKTGALRFPDLAGVDVRAKTRVPGLSDVEYFAQSMYEPTAYVVAGIPPGDAPDQQASDRPHRSGDPLRDRVPPETWRHADGHAADETSLQQRRGGTAARRRLPRLLRRRADAAAPPKGTHAMKILVVLAVAAVFALLRFRRANLLMWAGAWWVGIYVLLRFGFTAPIPASVISIYMGIISLAILAYVSSSEERREEVSGPLVRFMTEKRYTVLLVATVVAIPALAAANVYVQMNVPLQPPLFSRTVHPASPSEITVHDKKIDLDTGENPSGISRRRIRPSSASTSRTGARSTIGTASSATATTWPATACSCTGWTRSRPTSPTRGRSRCCARRSCSGGFPREAPGFPRKGAPGTRPCRPGRSS